MNPGDDGTEIDDRKGADWCAHGRGSRSFTTTGAQSAGAIRLTPLWAASGEWTGVAGDENSKTAFALDPRGRVAELDSTGTIALCGPIRAPALTMSAPLASGHLPPPTCRDQS